MRAALPAVAVALTVAAGVALAGNGPEECLAQGATADPDVESRISCPGAAPTTPPVAQNSRACAATAGFARASASPSGRRVRVRFTRTVSRPVTVDVFQSSIGKRILGNRRIARFTRRSRSFTYSGRGARNGFLFVRFRVALPKGSDVRRVVLERRNGRFVRRPDFYRRGSCGTLTQFKLERPAFGGRTNRALDIAYRLSERARVSVVVIRGARTVKRYTTRTDRSNQTFRLRLASEKLRRGRYTVRITATPSAGGKATVARLFAQRL